MDLSVEQWRERGHFSRLLGREIFCVDSGELDKPVIFLIHGFPTSSWDWAPIWAALNASYRLVALDMLGFGFSDKPRSHRYSIMEQADLCEALLIDRRLGTVPRPGPRLWGHGRARALGTSKRGQGSRQLAFRLLSKRRALS